MDVQTEADLLREIADLDLTLASVRRVPAATSVHLLPSAATATRGAPMCQARDDAVTPSPTDTPRLSAPIPSGTPRHPGGSNHYVNTGDARVAGDARVISAPPPPLPLPPSLSGAAGPLSIQSINQSGAPLAVPPPPDSFRPPDSSSSSSSSPSSSSSSSSFRPPDSTRHPPLVRHHSPHHPAPRRLAAPLPTPLISPRSGCGGVSGGVSGSGSGSGSGGAGCGSSGSRTGSNSSGSGSGGGSGTECVPLCVCVCVCGVPASLSFRSAVFTTVQRCKHPRTNARRSERRSRRRGNIQKFPLFSAQPIFSSPSAMARSWE